MRWRRSDASSSSRCRQVRRRDPPTRAQSRARRAHARARRLARTPDAAPRPAAGRTLAGPYGARALTKYSIELSEHAIDHGGVRYCPLLQFYDSTHVGRVDAYLRIFGKGHFSRGDFIEDTLGQTQLAAIRQSGMGAFGVHVANWVVDDGTDEARAPAPRTHAAIVQPARPGSSRARPALACPRVHVSAR